MELIMVNSQKLKIILTSEDMKNMDITNETLDYSSPETKKAIDKILEKAKAETGFYTGDDRLYIQVFPSFDGGCEMFLTRRAKLFPDHDDGKPTHFKKKSKVTSLSVTEGKSYIAASENLENILALCIRMYKDGFSEHSALHHHNNRYLLTVSFKKYLPSFVPSTKDRDRTEFGYINEYADVYFANELLLSYINEHATPIVKSKAVEFLAKKFGEV